MKSSSELQKQIDHWDKTHVLFLKNLYREQHGNPNFEAELLSLFLKDNYQIASTWLIKYHYEQKRKLRQSSVNHLFENSHRLNEWEAKLHLLQLLPYLDLSDKLAEAGNFIRTQLAHDKKFVRAAALETFSQLIQYIPEYKNEAIALAEMAMEKESASIKVKARRILKRFK